MKNKSSPEITLQLLHFMAVQNSLDCPTTAQIGVPYILEIEGFEWRTRYHKYYTIFGIVRRQRNGRKQKARCSILGSAKRCTFKAQSLISSFHIYKLSQIIHLCVAKSSAYNPYLSLIKIYFCPFRQVTVKFLHLTTPFLLLATYYVSV